MKNTVILLIICSLMIFGQDYKNRPQSGAKIEGSVSGKVLDRKTEKPIEYCNVVLIRQRDSSLVGGIVTDAQGNYKIEVASPGRYVLKVSFIGYDTRKIDSVFVTPKTPNVKIRDIYLADHYQRLGEVVVKGERLGEINNLDKKVINVDKNLAAQNGSAMEVIQNVPSVSIDVNGNLSMRGSSNVTILINGKPSGMVGLNGSDVLNQIPASSIETVEIVTNPSVKYDPEGTSGIINIVLKKKEDSGFNGMASLNAGTQDKYNSSVNLNYKSGDVNFFTNYDNRFNSMEATSDELRRLYSLTLDTLLHQTGEGKMKMNSNNLNVGMDYSIDKNSSINVSWQFRRFNMENNNNILNSRAAENQDPFLSYNQLSSMERHMRSNELEAGYKKSFDDKGRNLTIDLSYDNAKMDGSQNSSQINIYPGTWFFFPQRSVTDNSHSMIILQSNYNHPFSEDLKIESGFKISSKKITSHNDYDIYSVTLNDWVRDDSKKNYMDFKENIYALYTMLTGEIFTLRYQTGLRFESVRTTIDVPGSVDEYVNSYTSLYPSIHLSKDIGPGQELMLSLSRRVDRPNNRQLNPYKTIDDPLNIRVGNPKLQPQYTNSFELGYALNAGPSSFTTTAFLRHTSGIISTISQLDPNNPVVTITTFENIDKLNSYGLELTATHPLFSWWRINANGSYFKSDYQSQIPGQNIDKSNYSWMAKVNSMFNLPLGLQMTVMFNYNSAIISPQGRTEKLYSTDAGMKKDFLNGDLTVNMRVTDIFHTLKYISETNGVGFVYNSENIRNSRVAYLGISYRLFNFERPKAKEKREGDDIDM